MQVVGKLAALVVTTSTVFLTGLVDANGAHAQPLVVGCSDGTREGFTDLSLYPNIASCGGAWTVAGAFHDEPACGRQGGDDGVNATGTGCNVEDLCAGGWHMCHGPDDIDTRTGGRGCADSVMAGYPGTGAFFMTRTSGAGTGHCDEVVNGLPANFNDIFGCGNMGAIPVAAIDEGGCSPLNRFGHNQCTGLQSYDPGGASAPATEFGYTAGNWAWACNDGGGGINESKFVTKSRPGDQGGVLCCKDTDATLPEICDSGIDNDADGLVDETDFDHDGATDDFPGDPCTQGNGQPGTIQCTGGGGWICGPVPSQGCCHPDGQCNQRAPAFCIAEGGSPGGAGSNCGSMICQAEPCYLGDGSDCDDGDPCTIDDVCDGGVCGGDPNPCDDGVACTLDACNNGSCSHTASAAACDDRNPCTNDLCGPSGCVHQANVEPCDDGNPCTIGDTCSAGTCVGNLLNCDDHNPCTDDACGATACVHTNNTAACTDGNACTQNDTCSGGQCVGVALGCDDANPCTDDSCANGACVHQNNSAPSTTATCARAAMCAPVVRAAARR